MENTSNMIVTNNMIDLLELPDYMVVVNLYDVRNSFQLQRATIGMKKNDQQPQQTIPDVTLDRRVEQQENNKPIVFVKGDKVLCYAGTKLYRATCLDSRKLKLPGKKDHLEYRVMYESRTGRINEWVNADRVLRINSDNVLHMKTYNQMATEKLMGRM